ncbi:MAG: aminotransferase class V-fold PLP-dependent enzyme [Candidatus Margulisiibacteriota bacterium]
MQITYFQARRMANLYGLRTDAPTLRALDTLIRGKKLGVEELRHLIPGSSRQVMVFDPHTGTPTGLVPHIKMNYAATKPTILPVLDTTTHLELLRENVGRSAGPDAEVMSQALEEARDIVGRFVGYNRDRDVVVFVENTTAAMNLLVRKAVANNPNLHFVVSLAAHHSTQLPARETGHFHFFRLKPDGSYDLNSLEDELISAKKLGTKVILCIESESNVTGIKNPIKEICALADMYDVTVFIDHAQGGSNIPINLTELPGEVYVAISGHKLYGPTGSGAVIGPMELFIGPALNPGGGEVSGVTSEKIFYSKPPHNCEAGTPAFIAQIGFAKALSLLMEVGLENIAERERQLLTTFWPKLLSVEGLQVLGGQDLSAFPRGPVVSFRLQNLEGTDFIAPGFIGYALQAFYGVDSRVGQFCAHTFIYHLLGIDIGLANKHAELHAALGKAGCAALEGDQHFHSTRFSWAFPTTDAELSALPDMLREIQHLWPNNSVLQLDKNRGAFHIPGQPNILTEGTFSLQRRTPYLKL